MNKIHEIFTSVLGTVGAAIGITDITNVVNLILLIISLVNILLVLYFNIKKHIKNGTPEEIPSELEKAQKQLENLAQNQNQESTRQEDLDK